MTQREAQNENYRRALEEALARITQLESDATASASLLTESGHQHERFRQEIAALTKEKDALTASTAAEQNTALNSEKETLTLANGELTEQRDQLSRDHATAKQSLTSAATAAEELAKAKEQITALSTEAVSAANIIRWLRAPLLEMAVGLLASLPRRYFREFSAPQVPVGARKLCEPNPAMPDVGLSTATEPLSKDMKVVIKYSVEVNGLPVYSESYDIEKLADELKEDEAKAVGIWSRRIKCVVACRTRPGFSSCVTRCLTDGRACECGHEKCEPVSR